MVVKERDSLFEKYKRVAYRVAKNFSEKYGLLYEDVAGEAICVLLEYTTGKCCGEEFKDLWKFKKKGTKESSWLYQNIHWRLMNIYNKNRVVASVSIHSEKEESKIDPPAKSNWLGRLLSEVSEEGKFLIKTIISAPAEIAEEVSPVTYGKARKAVKGFLIDQEDWSISKFYRTWEEVKSCL